MSLQIHDTIFAPITGNQPAAVAWVRLSGPESWNVAALVFTAWTGVANMAVYGRYTFGDDGYAIAFEEGKSFTGDRSTELSIHGSPVAVRRLLEACRELGARPAGPGEFTMRAFINGRIDLAQAEAVRDTVNAVTDEQFRLATLGQKEGLGAWVQVILKRLTRVLAEVEARVDFSEELGDLDFEAIALELRAVADALEAKAKQARYGRLIREGATIAIVGAPNVGKSSLLNAVLGEDRAIVTAIPGTTRDRVEEVISVSGFLVRLIDTAGQRETVDEVEKLGIEKSLSAMHSADLVWNVYDASRPETRLEVDGLLVSNKSDLANATDGVKVSCRTGSGIQELLDISIGQIFGSIPSEVAFPNRRHQDLLVEACESVRDASEVIAAQLPADLATVHLNTAISRLQEITGEQVSEDMLTRIFADFCIGK